MSQVRQFSEFCLRKLAFHIGNILFPLFFLIFCTPVMNLRVHIRNRLRYLVIIAGISKIISLFSLPNSWIFIIKYTSVSTTKYFSLNETEIYHILPSNSTIPATTNATTKYSTVAAHRSSLHILSVMHTADSTIHFATIITFF